MSLFVRLSTVAVVAVLLRCVPATVDITAPSTVTANTVSGSLTCPVASVYTTPGCTVQAAGQEYHRATIPVSRLSFTDVRTKDMNSISMDTCAAAASSEGRNAFSFVKNVCKLYTFGKDFSPCIPGEFEIYINKKLLGVTTDLGNNRVAAKDMKEMVIYPEVSWTAGPFQRMVLWKSSEEGDLAECQNNIRGLPGYYVAAIVLGNYCHLTGLIDVANCNQPCRGDQPPVQAIVLKANPIFNIGTPFLSLCGRNVSIPLAAGTIRSTIHVSHAGYGCYPYPEAKRFEDEDCLVIFQKGAGVKKIGIHMEFVGLNGAEDACHDFISVHAGKIPDKAKNKKRYCKGTKQMLFEDVFAVNFHRMQDNKGVRLNMGFKLTYESNP